MKAVLITILLCVSIICVHAQEKRTEAVVYTQGDQCSQENLLKALQKAARQLPDPLKDSYTTLTFSSGTMISSWDGRYVDKYSGLPYIERLKAIAEDKEKEAKDARELAQKEETRENDIKLVKKLAKECVTKSDLTIKQW